MKVYLLGTGGALSGPKRGNTSLVVATDRTSLLVECSGNPARELSRVGLDPQALDHLLISHRHPDHLYALPALIQQLLIGSLPDGRGPLTIWGPESALAVGRRLLEAVELLGRDDLFELRFRSLPDEPHTELLGDLVMTTFPVDHGDVPTLGLKVSSAEADEEALVYSSDTQPCDAVSERSRQASVLLHECSFLTDECMASHTAFGQIESILRGTPVPKVVLIHLPPMSLEEEQSARLQLIERFGDRVVLGDDGMVFES